MGKQKCEESGTSQLRKKFMIQKMFLFDNPLIFFLKLEEFCSSSEKLLFQVEVQIRQNDRVF